MTYYEQLVAKSARSFFGFHRWAGTQRLGVSKKSKATAAPQHSILWSATAQLSLWIFEQVSPPKAA